MEPKQRAGRTTALWLALVAAAIYVGFYFLVATR